MKFLIGDHINIKPRKGEIEDLKGKILLIDLTQGSYFYLCIFNSIRTINWIHDEGQVELIYRPSLEELLTDDCSRIRQYGLSRQKV